MIQTNHLVDAAAHAMADWSWVMTAAVAGQAIQQIISPETPGFAMMAEAQDQLAVLAMSGVGGAFAKATFFPQQGWRKRALHGVSSAISAVFLGGLLGFAAVKLGVPELYAFMSAGFLTAFAGKEGIALAQTKLFGKGGT